MFDRDVALEALSTVLSASVTSVQKQHREVQVFGGTGGSFPIVNLFSGLLLSQVSGTVFSSTPKVFHPFRTTKPNVQDIVTGQKHVIDENEFFDPNLDYDFTDIDDSATFYRGGEEYKRPCGWYRYALKVLDKYDDGNTWLGTSQRTTKSVPGEWPVSYHGTSTAGADGIIGDHFKAGGGQVYGRGIYSTPDLSVAEGYANQFTFKNKRYKVIVQNRINPQYRQKHNDDLYWLVSVPNGTSAADEQKMAERSIRPYGLLVKVI